MMKFKELMGYWLRWILAVFIVSCIVLEPMAATAASKTTNAKTLAELRKELKEMQAKKAAADKGKKLTQSEITAKNNAIADAHKQIEESEAKIEEAKKNITTTEEDIKALEEKTQEVLRYYQIMSGENVALEFISNSKSMTELIMNVDAMEVLANTNKEKLVELGDLIKSLEQQQVDLKNYEKEQESNIVTYQKKIEDLEVEYRSYTDDAMDAQEEINFLKEMIEMYEEMGCKENESLDACMNNVNNSTFLKPVTKGRITSVFGYRNVAGQSSNHSGVDIGVSEGTTVYSMTAGTVAGTVSKSSCGGNKVYINTIVNGQKYVVAYLHLLSINVKKGDKVTNQTIIGKSGGGSTAQRNGGYDRCTTGAHLHVSVSKGYWENDAKYRANLINPPGFPPKGGWFYSRTQWFGPKV